MALETATPASRRALLTAGLGGLVALVAGALGRPAPTRATDGDPVLVGGNYTATGTTQISNTTDSSIVLLGVTGDGVGVRGSAGSGIGVHGTADSGSAVAGQSNSGAGVNGFSASAVGVRGSAGSGTGVRGASSSGIGIHGFGLSATLPAIVGQSDSASTGVLGFSGTGGALPAAPARTGVYGYAAQSVSSRGVYGRTIGGRGVYGQATSGVGLYGLASTGYALRTSGKVRLDKSAGTTTITAGTRSKTVTPGVDLTSSTAVLATLQASAGGTTTVHRVAINATMNTFTIYLTANATVNVRVGWILLS
jgi:hypothetical protein